MERIRDFINSIPFIASFLILALLIQITAGAKVLNAFLWLVFLSMVAVNYKKLEDFINKINKGV